jgi:hypothetical protein
MWHRQRDEKDRNLARAAGGTLIASQLRDPSHGGTALDSFIRSNPIQAQLVDCASETLNFTELAKVLAPRLRRSADLTNEILGFEVHGDTAWWLSKSSLAKKPPGLRS